jgi:hypothetical protein
MIAVYKCAKCEANDDEHRLYRDYGMFFREKDVRCNACLEGTDWMVPLCADRESGDVWGYTSVPEDACTFFYGKPEKDPESPTWLTCGQVYKGRRKTHAGWSCAGEEFTWEDVK